VTLDVRSMTVPPGSSIADAMRAIDGGRASVALVVDAGGRLVGILTDGDIRRALLAGATLADPVGEHVRTDFLRVAPATSRVEVLDLMQARSINQVPVVDAAGRVVALHLLREVVGSHERPNWAVVMAGGRGARLGELTADRPKPMVNVAGRPILERIVLHLVGSGIRRIFISINYLGHVIEAHFGDGSRHGCEIAYLREEQPLGTAGSLSLLPERATEPLLVMNGDLVTDAPLGAIVDWHAAGGHAATIALRRYVHEVPFGCVSLDGDRVTSLEEKPRLTSLVNTGIYVIEPDVAARVPRDTPRTMPDLLEEVIEAGETVRGFEIESDWLDVGRRDQLELARVGGGG
jgi:dTDP-glucose pyrophosphorylase